MNIAFDVDGVLTDFEYFLDTYGHRYFSKKYKTDAIVTNPYTAKISERFGYGYEKLRYICRLRKNWDKYRTKKNIRSKNIDI
jgi:uncharacterized HAD superfamily protein